MLIATLFGILLGVTSASKWNTPVDHLTVFAWTGIGRLLVRAIYNRDYPVVQGVVFVVSSLFILVNIIVDYLYAYIDPRIKFD